jgi:hypothetical protein
MATAVSPTPFDGGKRLHDGNTMNAVAAQPLWSAQDAVTATASGTQATSVQLTAAVTRLSTVATANDGVLAPISSAGKMCVIINDTANAATVFGSGSDTINDVAAATGILLPANTMGILSCPVQGKWYCGTDAFNYQTGTFTANGVTAVTVSDTGITANSQVLITLKTVGGTVGATPYVATITAGTGFTTIATASNTSVYNYAVIG